MLELVERIAALEKAVFYTNVHPVTKYRKMQGWTREELAMKINCSVSLLSEIEQGKKFPLGELVIKLSQALEVPNKTLLKELTNFISNK